MATSKSQIKSDILAVFSSYRKTESELESALLSLFKAMENAALSNPIYTKEQYAEDIAEIIRDAVTTDEDSMADALAGVIQDAIQSADITGATTVVASGINVQVDPNTGIGATTVTGAGAQDNTINPV